MKTALKKEKRKTERGHCLRKMHMQNMVASSLPLQHQMVSNTDISARRIHMPLPAEDHHWGESRPHPHHKTVERGHQEQSVPKMHIYSFLSAIGFHFKDNMYLHQWMYALVWYLQAREALQRLAKKCTSDSIISNGIYPLKDTLNFLDLP